MVTITTERLALREWRDEDAGPLYELARDAAVGPAAGWPPHRDEQDGRGQKPSVQYKRVARLLLRR